MRGLGDDSSDSDSLRVGRRKAPKDSDQSNDDDSDDDVALFNRNTNAKAPGHLVLENTERAIKKVYVNTEHKEDSDDSANAALF